MHDLDPRHSSLELQHIQDSLQFKQFSELSHPCKAQVMRSRQIWLNIFDLH